MINWRIAEWINKSTKSWMLYLVSECVRRSVRLWGPGRCRRCCCRSTGPSTGTPGCPTLPDCSSGPRCLRRRWGRTTTGSGWSAARLRSPAPWQGGPVYLGRHISSQAELGQLKLRCILTHCIAVSVPIKKYDATLICVKYNLCDLFWAGEEQVKWLILPTMVRLGLVRLKDLASLLRPEVKGSVCRSEESPSWEVADYHQQNISPLPLQKLWWPVMACIVSGGLCCVI